MQTSSDFRAHNTVLASLPLLRDQKVQQPVGDQQVSLGPLDVLDVNRNGQLDLEARPAQNGQRFNVVELKEPVVGTFRRPQLHYLADLKVRPGQSEVLTQDEVMPGWLMARQAAILASGGQSQVQVLDAQPVEALMPALGFDPREVRYAIDFASQEFLVYKPGQAAEPAAAPQGKFTTASGLGVEVLKPGQGAPARLGALVNVHYVGTLPDGTRFDSSRDRGTPFQFQLGEGSVIRGWEEGLEGARVGEVRRLTVPPSLGYGDRQTGSIPPNSTLTFEVEVLPPQGK